MSNGPIDPRAPEPTTRDPGSASRLRRTEQRLGVLERTVTARATAPGSGTHAIPLASGVTSPDPDNPAIYYMDTLGRVFFSGTVQLPSPAAHPYTWATMPAGFRPRGGLSSCAFLVVMGTVIIGYTSVGFDGLCKVSAYDPTSGLVDASGHTFQLEQISYRGIP